MSSEDAPSDNGLPSASPSHDTHGKEDCRPQSPQKSLVEDRVARGETSDAHQTHSSALQDMPPSSEPATPGAHAAVRVKTEPEIDLRAPDGDQRSPNAGWAQPPAPHALATPQSASASTPSGSPMSSASVSPDVARTSVGMTSRIRTTIRRKGTPPRHRLAGRFKTAFKFTDRDTNPVLAGARAKEIADRRRRVMPGQENDNL